MQVFIKSELKVGVIYVKEGQYAEEEILDNNDNSPLFEEFLQILGDKVRLKGEYWRAFCRTQLTMLRITLSGRRKVTRYPSAQVRNQACLPNLLAPGRINFRSNPFLFASPLIIIVLYLDVFKRYSVRISVISPS